MWAYVEGIAIGETAEATATAPTQQLMDSQNRYQVLYAVGTNLIYQATSKGIGLFHTFAIPFYQEDIEDEYLDLDRYKPIEIEWYGYKDDNTHRIILEKPIGQGPSEYA
jgi:hypothetical protein